MNRRIARKVLKSASSGYPFHLGDHPRHRLSTLLRALKIAGLEPTVALILHRRVSVRLARHILGSSLVRGSR